jgi:hypothetical protein
MSDYCTLSDIYAQLPESGLASSTDYTAGLSMMITAASRIIDTEVGGWPDYFVASTDASIRYFRGSGTDVQEIDACLSVSAVAVDEGDGTYTAWASTDYYAAPVNYASLSLPITSLIIDDDGDEVTWFGGRKSVKVTARWGRSATVPADVNQACITQVVRWYMKAKQAWQDAGASPAVGQMTYGKLDEDVRKMLWKYVAENMTP